MGSSTSKAVRTAAGGAARRQYPKRVPPQSTSTSTSNASSAPPPPAGRGDAPGPSVHPRAQASSVKDESVSLDASDPDFAASLRSLGPVQPSSTLSNSSAFNPSGSSKSSPNQAHPQMFPDASQNPALILLRARERLQQEAEAEFAKSGRGKGERRFLDISTIRQVLVMRDDKAMGEEQIERNLGLAKGVVRGLGAKGVVGDVRVGKVTAEDSGLYG
ncbi:hypothetical protein N7G274_007141 [Stereocaulon virgatum]|uniref:Helix-turn-helix domain-containing protein n=1 Tax=Stereocaulon virgatum TaxID=373712 RepID=A0ABR4AA52_9LECA